jgi:enoyl-CoA hydratase
MRYSLTSEEFGADEARRMNVVALVRPSAEAEAAGLVLAREICNAAPLAVQAAIAQAQTWADRGGRGRLRAFGTGYHPVAELTRCG